MVMIHLKLVIVISYSYVSVARPSRTSCGMYMKNMNILSKNVMRYGHILRQDLRYFGELKFLNLLFFRLIFLLMRLNFYPSVCYMLEY